MTPIEFTPTEERVLAYYFGAKVRDGKFPLAREAAAAFGTTPRSFHAHWSPATGVSMLSDGDDGHGYKLDFSKAKLSLDMAAHDVNPADVLGSRESLMNFAIIRCLEPMFDRRRTKWSSAAAGIRVEMPRWTREMEALFGGAVKKLDIPEERFVDARMRYLWTCRLALANYPALHRAVPPSLPNEFAYVMTIDEMIKSHPERN